LINEILHRKQLWINFICITQKPLVRVSSITNPFNPLKQTDIFSNIFQYVIHSRHPEYLHFTHRRFHKCLCASSLTACYLYLTVLSSPATRHQRHSVPLPPRHHQHSLTSSTTQPPSPPYPAPSSVLTSNRTHPSHRFIFNLFYTPTVKSFIYLSIYFVFVLSCSGCTHELNLHRPIIVDEADQFFKSVGVSDFDFDSSRLVFFLFFIIILEY
jgi:hypothetical protein